MTRSYSLIVLILCGLPLQLGCKAYVPLPLNPAEVVHQLDHTRQHPDMSQATVRDTGGEVDPKAEAEPGQNPPAFTLKLAADWLLRYGPEILEVEAEYRTALAKARIKTPLPNPTLSMGAEYGFGRDVSTRRVVPFGSIGFQIPTGDRLEQQDQLNQAAAEVAQVRALTRHRELYLSLRELYTRLATVRRRHAARLDIARSAERSVEASRRLVEAGQAVAADIALFELEHARSEVDVLNSRVSTATVESALATLIGVHARHFVRLPEQLLPKLADQLPSLESLKEMLILHHPELARLRARYAASERALRLEIAKQYPDLSIGGSGRGEVGDRKVILGLPLGIELPLFDRNEQGIAEAEGRREEVRTHYTAAASRALAALEHAYRVAQLSGRTRRILQQTILAKARNSIQLARRALAAGSGDVLRLLDSERTFRQVQIEALEAELADYRAWSALERATGWPLMKFPHEPGGHEGTEKGTEEVSR